MNAVPRPTISGKQTVIAYLRQACRYDDAGHKAIRDIFSHRWPSLYGELLHSEGVMFMTTEEADCEERRLIEDDYAIRETEAGLRWWGC